MRKQFLFGLVLLLISGHCWAQQIGSVQQIGEDMQLIPLTENTMIHRSFKMSEDYGRFPSNGLLYFVDSLCIIFDTPITTKTTTRLLDYLMDEQGYTVVAVVANHFHEDCTAGLDSVHARGITTYGHRKTARLCVAEGTTPPQKKMGKRKKIKIGDQEIVNFYPGPGHSPDNMVSYVPGEEVLFGGCMVKAYNASKGNLADANLDKWSASVEKVRQAFPTVEKVVPGHGFPGGTELLDYTIELFTPEE